MSPQNTAEGPLVTMRRSAASTRGKGLRPKRSSKFAVATTAFFPIMWLLADLEAKNSSLVVYDGVDETYTREGHSCRRIAIGSSIGDWVHQQDVDSSDIVTAITQVG
ncbi:MAG: hypothetical protein WAK20_18420 [Candidatus Acidiferrum sp.]